MCQDVIGIFTWQVEVAERHASGTAVNRCLHALVGHFFVTHYHIRGRAQKYRDRRVRNSPLESKC